MMRTQAYTEIQAITATARRLNVTLPAELESKAEHLESLTVDHRTSAPPTPAAIADQLGQHLGNPTAMAKARTKAAADLATSAAGQQISAILLERCAVDLHSQLRQQAQTVTATFGNALADALDVLNTDAGTLPQGFKAEHAAALTPSGFAAWTRVRDALTLIESVLPALRPFYRTPSDTMLTADAVGALRFVKPPTLSNPLEAHTFARALAGTQHGGGTLGPVNVDGVSMPTAVAHLGGTFAWAAPAEVTARAEAINTAAIPQQRERNAPRAYITL